MDRREMNKLFTKNIYTNYKHVLKMNSLAFKKGFLLSDHFLIRQT